MNKNSLPTASQRFFNGIIPENPTYRLLLGMCPTLAVTSNVQAALTMAAATTFVLFCSNIMISLIRNLLQPHLRILVFTLTIATFVTVVDRLLAAEMPEMSNQLGPYIPLIIVNCIIISRCEVCASVQGPFISAVDGLGVGVGFTLGLTSIATVREILGMGTWFGFQVLPPEVWTPWSVMILPPGAFLTLGMLLALVNFIESKRQQGKES
ncbi:MAG: electron transport complex subunit RsxE [Thermoguttaceae bacterium]|nr:electron transport complex subunit RsxE [Thermoguttaceae bacterium]MBP3693829.1 electron transport complex subunit RsxE [Thermoguttaceae bacterium]